MCTNRGEGFKTDVVPPVFAILTYLFVCGSRMRGHCPRNLGFACFVCDNELRLHSELCDRNRHVCSICELSSNFQMFEVFSLIRIKTVKYL